MNNDGGLPAKYSIEDYNMMYQQSQIMLFDTLNESGMAHVASQVVEHVHQMIACAVAVLETQLKNTGVLRDDQCSTHEDQTH